MLQHSKGMVTQFEELTDAQWQVMEKYLPVQRKRTLCLRQVSNAILYILRSGCQWRNLPQSYPNWQAVYYYFFRWKQDGCLGQLNRALNILDRLNQDREAHPSLLCIDSQSVKLAPMIFEDRGTDAAKQVNGRKRQVAVDSGGRLWAVHVHAANDHDSRAGCHLLWHLKQVRARLKVVLTDSGYRGRFADWVTKMGLSFEVASKPPNVRGFVPVKTRWVVERSFAWLNFFRRVTKDYEHTAESSESWLLWANCALMLNRISTNTE
jgi:transposase